MSKPRSRTWYAAVATLVFLAANYLSDLMRLLQLKRFMPWLVVLGIRNTLEVSLCFVGVAIAHRFGFRRSAAELGLRAPVGRAVAFGMLASAPMLIAFAWAFRPNPNMTFLTVGVGCIVAPFAEEVLFRAFLFRQLYRRARLGFWLSALIPSVLFAAAHVYQATAPAELLGILAITGAGGLLSCWVFTRWQDNVWTVFSLHALMNLWWEVFAVDETALGGWLANAARLATVGLAILLTIYKDRIWRPLPSEAENIRLTQTGPEGPSQANAERRYGGQRLMTV